MLVRTEPTPNPEVVKFIPGTPVLGDGALDLRDAEAAQVSPLASRLFTVPGVAAVFLGGDFVSVTRQDGVDWAELKTDVIAALSDHAASGEPVLAQSAGAAAAGDEHSEASYEGEDAEIVDQIKDLLDTRIRPAVASDGGDILFDAWEPDTGTVRLHMRGACAGCPASTMTLKSGVENMLRHYVPEVQTVEAVL
jgi:Fe-S cluster biogenesis protein NfuA